MLWDSVPGQGALKKRLSDIVRHGQISHAYILEASDLSAGMQMARGFAQLLLCDHGTGCGTCRSCRLVEMGSHLDVIYVLPEKNNVLTVDEIRKKLVDDMEIRPFRSSRKIYVVDQADRMTVEAQNALLKTLEEPPAYGIILLLAENSESFLPTILSRCVLLRLQTEEDPEEKFPEEERRAVLSACRALPELDSAGISGVIDNWQEAHIPSETIMILFRYWFRDMLLWKSAGKDTRFLLHSESRNIREAAENYSFLQIQKALSAVDRAETRIYLNVNETITFHMLLMDCRPVKENRSLTAEEFDEYLIPDEEEKRFYRMES